MLTVPGSPSPCYTTKSYLVATNAIPGLATVSYPISILYTRLIDQHILEYLLNTYYLETVG